MIYRKSADRRRIRPVRRGASLVEMAFIVPVVLLLLLGTIDFAQVMYAYGTVSEAARAGARYAMVHGSMAASPVGPTANDSTVATIVKNNAPALNPAQLTVSSSWPWGSNRAGCQVCVSASYTCPLSVGKLIGMNSVTVTGSTTMLITH
jgi:Flp pilus assembly protein TadG